MSNPPTLDALPTLIIVTGRPGAGKTTLARAVARAVRCPVLCRDEVKEGFVNTARKVDPAASPGDEVGRHVNDAFFDSVRLLLSRQITLVAEAAFQHKLWAPALEPLMPLAHVRIILCHVPAELARSRHIERGLADPLREEFHGDAAVRAARQGRQLPLSEYDPPHLDVPMLMVDTTDRYRPDLDAVVNFALGKTTP